MKVLTVVGARPQFIKAATVSQELHRLGIKEYLLHTGQHYDTKMSKVFFDELSIKHPNKNLNVGSGTHGEQTAAMIIGIEEAAINEKPDIVLLYGDTNSTLAGAIAASKLHIPIAHVESGLRSRNRAMPEEINRIVTDSVSSILFAPTEQSIKNLINEGVDESKIIYTGDVMYDAALIYKSQAVAKSSILSELKIEDKNYALATVHRAENTDNAKRLKNIFGALCEFSKQYPVVLPLHPRTRAKIGNINKQEFKNIIIIEPVGFMDMIRLESSALIIVTDSGGVQKEAFFHKVQCVTMRNETEWTELVEARWNRLARPDSIEEIQKAIEDAQKALGIAVQPYGDGNARVKIGECIRENINNNKASLF